MSNMMTEQLPRDFGDGWMTNNARDLAKIAVTMAGFDAEELVRRLAAAPSRGDRINTRTVENVLGQMRRECCFCMTEDPGDGYGERVVTHSGECPLNPDAADD